MSPSNCRFKPLWPTTGKLLQEHLQQMIPIYAYSTEIWAPVWSSLYIQELYIHNIHVCINNTQMTKIMLSVLPNRDWTVHNKCICHAKECIESNKSSSSNNNKSRTETWYSNMRNQSPVWEQSVYFSKVMPNCSYIMTAYSGCSRSLIISSKLQPVKEIMV